MFVVASQPEPLSTSVMRFRNLWIFDLSTYHDFWKSQIQSAPPHSGLAWDPLVWRALLKFYGLHLFSATEELQTLAFDFHAHKRNPISVKETRDLFAVFRRLGLQKIGHLRRLPFSEIRKRFGKMWTDFFQGVLEPERASWIWEPYRASEPLSWSLELDEPSCDAVYLLENISEGLRQLAEGKASFRLQKLELRLHLSDPETLSLDFIHPLFFQKDLVWIRHLFQERLFRLCLDAPVWRIHLKAYPAEYSPSLQLSLFKASREKEVSDLQFRKLLERLENQNFKLFVPTHRPSYLPEESWEKASPLQGDPLRSQTGILRPLIQHSLQPISPPSGGLKATETLEWFDREGKIHRREYFVLRGHRQWIWAFRTEEGQWFRQGIVE